MNKKEKEIKALMEEWKGRSSYSAEFELRKYGFNCREPYIILDYGRMALIGLEEHRNFRIYDGAVMSEDGRFVALMSKKNMIKANRDTYLYFRECSLCLRNLKSCQERWTDKRYMTPSEIFTVVMTGLFSDDNFHALVDDDDLYCC